MASQHQANIALSGWSGAGTSTITLILAILLQRKYYYIGSVFREIGQRLGHLEKNKEDKNLPKFESFIQPKIGKIIDNYVDFKLLNANKIILETDISAFRLGKRSEYYSIFLKTDFKTRVQRFNWDLRAGGAKILKQRDIALQTEYQKLWNIDVFDTKLIKEKFNLVINNSDLTIAETVIKILKQLAEDDRFKTLGFQGLHLSTTSDISVATLSRNSGKTGKTKLQQQLADLGLIVSPESIMKEMFEIFPKEVDNLPSQIRKIFC